MLGKERSSLICKVICATAQPGNIGGKFNFSLTAAGTDDNLVAKTNALHNHANLMVAVFPASQNIQT